MCERAVPIALFKSRFFGELRIGSRIGVLFETKESKVEPRRPCSDAKRGKLLAAYMSKSSLAQIHSLSLQSSCTALI